jgi:anti-anti-sigma factor
MLEYRVERKDGGDVVVALRGALADEDWTDRLEAFLQEHYVDDGVTRIVLNLAGVEWVDLEGVATLIRLAHHARDRGKRLLITEASDLVRGKLERTGVLEYLS